MVNREIYLNVISKHFSEVYGEFGKIAFEKIKTFCESVEPFSHDAVMQYIGSCTSAKLGGVYAHTTKALLKIKEELRSLNKKEKRKKKFEEKLG